MANLEQVSLRQVVLLVVVSRLSQTLIFFGANPLVRQDIWWQGPLSALGAVGFVWLLQWLWLRFPGVSLTQVASLVLGKAAGRCLALTYAGVLVLTLSVTLRLTGEVFAFAFLPRTPMILVVAVVAFLAAWGAAEGLEVVAQSTEIVFPILVGSILLIVALLVKDLHTELLWPPYLLHTGPFPHLADVVSTASRTLELVVVGQMLPQVKERHGLFRAMFRAHIWLLVIWCCIGIAIVGILGPDYDSLSFPFFTVVRTVSIADFLERVEGLLLGVWLLGMFLRSALFLWSAALATADGLGLADYRPLVLPLGGIAAIYAIMQAESLMELRRYLRPEVYTPFSLTFVLAVPLLLLGIAAVRGLKGTDCAHTPGAAPGGQPAP